MRKLTAWLLLMVMVFSTSASSVALGEKSADAGKLPLTTEPIKLTIGLIPDDGVLDYDTNLYTAYLEEKTGVDIEFFYFPTTEFAQKLELMVAAQEELPDIILNMDLEDTAKFSYGQQGVFLPLNEYFEQYGYYWQETYEKYCTEEEKNIISSLSVSPDGNVYGFPFYEVDPTDTQVETIYINKSWCDNLGLAVPTTTDELYEVLCAFRDNDPNGNGLKDEIPLLGYNSVDTRGDLIFILANSFLYYNWSEYGRFVLEDGKLAASYTSEAFREALRYIHKLYEENLIAPYSFTQDAAQLRAMVDLPDDAETIVGAVAHHPWSGSEGFTWTKENYSKLKDYVAIGPLAGPEGIAYSPYQLAGLAFNSYITKDCENPEVAFRLLDFMSSEEASLTSRRGVQGVDWDYVAEGSTRPSRYADLGFEPIYDVMHDVWAEPEQNSVYAVTVHFMPSRLFAGVTLEDFPNELAEKRFHLYMDGFNRRYGQYPAEIVTKLVYTAEELEEIGELSTVITEYANQARVLFVTGDMDIDRDWDTYLKTLNDMGLEYWLEVAQTAYDRMNAK